MDGIADRRRPGALHPHGNVVTLPSRPVHITVDIAGAHMLVAYNQNINFWFDPAAFTTPPAFTWGTLGRNSLNAPALYNFDFSVAKKFKFSESRELQFRTELFNALNHPEFGLPNSTVGVGGAGTITSTQRANRQIQFALRLAF